MTDYTVTISNITAGMYAQEIVDLINDWAHDSALQPVEITIGRNT